jgi:hypothetical protein
MNERDVIAQALWSLHGLGWRLDSVWDQFAGVRSDGQFEERRVFLMARPGSSTRFGRSKADFLPFEAPLKARP